MAEPVAPIMSLDRVGKVFANGVAALSNFTLDVSTGELVSLLGPSGCGKSTVLRLMAGLMAPTTGRVFWPGSRIQDHRHEIGFVFQEPTLMPWADVADNVWMPLRLRGVSRKKASERIEECLSLVGLEGFADAYPRELSGGMKMRVSLARALVLKPRLLLMDEPFGALDEITRFRLNDDLLRLKRDLGATIVFVTHSIFESVSLSDRVIVMSPRPGTVAAEIRIDATPERGIAFRTSQSYGDLCRDISQVLANVATGTET
ncbi:ABC transporter ATP-binding protein [Microvirga puerhi]|uniref:ABC transporter ATP-binding protein n=1 Tax=Microvirga puerhi TaxID=2876078 RepID=A0ABS7VPH0_9HYPH|nr:ABC transporter ATP-binding protein [Microvirga puerhi]MBZ6077420.1 ABC transporter ATP-binding protein [Microvirga puerhi]